jgi:hypothetical protein
LRPEPVLRARVLALPRVPQLQVLVQARLLLQPVPLELARVQPPQL